MRITTLTLPAVAALALALSACGGGETKKTEKVVSKKVETKTTETKTTTKPDPTAVATPDPKPDEPATPDPNSPQGKVVLAASVAKEISVAPEQADEILGKHGLDRDKFDAIIFEIAGDPELTKAYMAARKTT
jgi:outer membrane biosynthesis protein TonB